MKISSRADHISPSPTLAIKAKAEQMKKQGIDVIGLGAGEPDFDTPDNIKEAAIEAIKQGFTKYTPSAGMLELREALAKKLNKENRVEFDPKKEIIITIGATEAVFASIITTINMEIKFIIGSETRKSFILSDEVMFGTTPCQ